MGGNQRKRSFTMKKKNKLIGIITVITLIMCLMAGCEFGGGNTGGNDTGGNTGGNTGDNTGGNDTGGNTGGNDTGGNTGGNTGGGGVVANPTITIKNSTGYTISGIYIKSSTSTNWGNNLWGYSSLSDGSSRTFTLTQPLSTQNVYDIRLSQDQFSGGFNFRKYGVTVSNGMTITFTTSDLNDGSNLPRITIQNRSGKNFDSFHVKPSAISDDWGNRMNLGSISNNRDLSVTISIPPSSYTVFDIQARSTNPTNTYTRNNVTITDGMTLTFTSADADNPTIELPVIVIQNSTGYTISGIYIKSSTSTNWGNNLWGYSSLSDESSRTFTLSQHLSAQNIYDIRLSQDQFSGGFKFIKYNVTVSEGMILTFTTSDFEP
jgi:hypothetical protein